MHFSPDRALAPPFNSTTDEATWLPSIIGGSNTVGRILFGILANSDRAVYSLLFTNVAVTLGKILLIINISINLGTKFNFDTIYRWNCHNWERLCHRVLDVGRVCVCVWANYR